MADTEHFPHCRKTLVVPGPGLAREPVAVECLLSKYKARVQTLVPPKKEKKRKEKSVGD
jgi:hypothetical protein